MSFPLFCRANTLGLLPAGGNSFATKKETNAHANEGSLRVSRRSIEKLPQTVVVGRRVL